MRLVFLFYIIKSWLTLTEQCVQSIILVAMPLYNKYIVKEQGFI